MATCFAKNYQIFDYVRLIRYLPLRRRLLAMDPRCFCMPRSDKYKMMLFH